MRTIKYLLAILFSIAVAACGSSGGGGDGGGFTHDTTYSITGTVTSSGAALSGVTITLTGGATTTTDASGNYSFTGLANGNYTVTPTMAGRAFSPVSSAVSVSGANVTGTNFAASAAATTYSIAGTVSGAASSGVTITLSGANTGSVVTGAGGAYTISGLVPGSYTVTPSLSGFTFAPTSKAVTISAANSTANDFVATAIPVAHSISGTVSGDTLSGVTITVTGTATKTATTDASGNYSVTGLFDGDYTVTPSKTGYTFNPSSSAKTISGANIPDTNFVATAYAPWTYSISGAVSGAVQSGVTVTLSGAGSATTTTNASGNYTFSGRVDGNYTVTPSLAGYTFSPASSAANVSGANVTVPNFVATTRGGGTTLRILPGQILSACKDTYTGKSYVTPQTLMAAGGSPFGGYTWSTSGFPFGTTVYSGVFKSSGGSMTLTPGRYPITIEVSDGPSMGAATATGSVTLDVTTVSSAPSGGVPGVPCPEAILQQYPSSSFALDDAYPSKPYGATLFAMGGTPPYSWSLDISGGLSVLPTGVTLRSGDGMVAGTPLQSTSGETFKFNVIVRDNAGVTKPGPAYTITVAP